MVWSYCLKWTRISYGHKWPIWIGRWSSSFFKVFFWLLCLMPKMSLTRFTFVDSNWNVSQCGIVVILCAILRFTTVVYALPMPFFFLENSITEWFCICFYNVELCMLQMSEKPTNIKNFILSPCNFVTILCSMRSCFRFKCHRSDFSRFRVHPHQHQEIIPFTFCSNRA